MDGDSGRVLYEKEGYTARPNASTTKVMTCILALENGKGDDYVMVSKNAAAQPEVKLGLKEGEQYYLEDLLYSLMLKSHNDTAWPLPSTSALCGRLCHMMNEKAKEIGCTSTHFVTSNGLDGADAGGVHETTARTLPDNELRHQKQNLSSHYPDKRLFFLRPFREPAVFRAQCKRLSGHDPGRHFRENRIHRKCRLLLCGRLQK